MIYYPIYFLRDFIKYYLKYGLFTLIIAIPNVEFRANLNFLF